MLPAIPYAATLTNASIGGDADQFPKFKKERVLFENTEQRSPGHTVLLRSVYVPAGGRLHESARCTSAGP